MISTRTRVAFVPTLLGALAIAGCSSGGSGTSTASTEPGDTNTVPTTSLTTTAPETSALTVGLPIVGDLVASCSESLIDVTGSAVREGPLGEPLSSLPVLGDVASTFPGDVPIVGGIVVTNGEWDPVAAAIASDVVGDDFAPTLLPVLGTLPILCEGATFDPGDPANLVGLVPIFDEQGQATSLLVIVVQGLVAGPSTPTAIRFPVVADLLGPVVEGITKNALLDPIEGAIDELPVLGTLLGPLF